MVLYCLLPQIHSMDKPEELQKKHPVRSPTFSKLPPPYCIFVQRDYHSGDFFHIRVSSYLICACFFTDAIITYSIQKSIVWIMNIYALFCTFLDIFHIFYTFFCFILNDLIFFANTFWSYLIYFCKLY